MPDEFSKGAWSNYQEKLVQTQARRAELREKFEKKDGELRILEEQLANVVKVLKDAEQIMEAAFGILEEPEESSPKTISGAASQIGPESPFYGKSLPECAVIVIREAGKALTEEEIVDGLKAGGVQIVSKMPQMNVRRSMARRPDILYNKNRKWAVIETPIDGDKLPQRRVVNNFTEAHAESTRNGIEAAKARGVAWGRPMIITPEKEQVIVEMRSRDLPAIEIAKAVGVSRTAYFNYLKERGMSKKYEFHEADEKHRETVKRSEKS